MKKRSKERPQTRPSTEAEKSRNSRGLHPPFTWDGLDAQVQEMEDIERYERLERQHASMRK